MNSASPDTRPLPFPVPYLGASLLGEEELALLTEVIRRKAPFRDYGLSQPHMVDDLEREAAAFLGARHVLGVSSGSAALYCAIAALGIGPGDEVILPSFSWYSNYNAIALAGATPVFADIDRSLNLDPADFARKITPATRAVMVIHFQGGPADLGHITATAKARGIAVIEDVAQAIGGAWQGRKLGTIGDIGIFSLQQNKVITAGEGGLFVSDNPTLFERAVRYHDHGLVRTRIGAQLAAGPVLPAMAGLQFRMSEFTGAVALAQLRKIDDGIIGPCRKTWRTLRERLNTACPGIALRKTGDDDGDIGIALYIDLGTPERCGAFAKSLRQAGIPTGPTSSVLNMAKSDLVQGGLTPTRRTVQARTDGCGNTDAIVASLCCIPITPHLTEAHTDRIAEAVTHAWKEMR